MRRIAVVVDGSADLPESLRAGGEIHVVPQILVVDGERLVEGKDITSEEIYEAVLAGVPVNIGHPPPDDFRVVYKKMRAHIEGIVTLTLSTTFNPTLISAQVAGITYPKLPTEVINSQQVSMGLGFVALAAARHAREGGNLEQVTHAAREAIPHVHTAFLPQDIRYPYRAGYLSRLAYLTHRALGHVPLLVMEKGHLVVREFGRGGDQGMERLVSWGRSRVGEAPVWAAIVHARTADLAERLAQQVRRTLHVRDVVVTTLTPIVGLRTGPGTVGLVLYEDASTSLIP